MPKLVRVRPMYVSELEALEVVLSHSDMEAVYSDWLDRGEPQYHFWNYLKILLDYLKSSKPDTPLDYPKIVEKVLPSARFDEEELKFYD